MVRWAVVEEWTIVLGLAATVVPTAAVIITALIQHRANRDAHTGIVARIADVEERAEKRMQAAEERAEKRTQAAEERAEKRADALARTLEAQRRALEAIARALSFLSGRQTERDRNPMNRT